jgi:hypothetical protein
MKRFVLLPVVFCAWLSCSGCNWMETAQSVPPITVDAFEKAEPLIVAIEDASGKRLNLAAMESAESKAEVVAGIAKKIAATSAAVGVVVPVAAPIAEGVAALASALALLAGGLAGFFRRRQRKATDALKVVVRAVESVEPELQAEVKGAVSDTAKLLGLDVKATISGAKA